VSRHYSDGKFNIMIYPKESAIRYSQNITSVEEKVESFDIEPLVIKDLQVKAKKK